MNQFEEMGIDEDFNPLYLEMGIKNPTEVQAKTIPSLMKRQSMICVAQTGTGKTLAYALPISELIKRFEDENGLNQELNAPQAVIVAPTKELAFQITSVFKKISHHAKLRVKSIVSDNFKGGIGVEVLVVTPHKLNQALKKKKINFDQLQFLVFDEADQLFDMGFKRDIEGILRHVEYDQTDIHFFSATMPADVDDFLQEKFKKKDLERLQLDSSHKVQQKITTFNLNLHPDEKLHALESFLKKTADGRGVIFVNQINQVEDVNKYLLERMPKLKFRLLHGDLPEKERLAVIKSFIQKKAQVLLATDVAARGIDIKDLDWVLNFGLPKTAIYYLHRCGRTGRAGREGKVFNFVTPYDNRIISQINASIKEQSSMDIGLIAQKPTKKRVEKPMKSKRLKITKRTRR